MKQLKFARLIKVLLLSITFLVAGCTHYIKLIPSPYTESYKQLNAESWNFRDYHNFIIIHYGEQVFELKNISFNQTNSTISGEVNSIISTPLMYYNAVKIHPQKICTMRQGDPINLAEQIHLYINNGQLKEGGKFEFLVNDINMVDETIHKSKGGLATGAIIAGSVVAAGLIVIVAACGCPHVYINDGKALTWQQTLFTGAKSPQLARSDVKGIIDYFPDQPTLTITLKNDEEEQQFIDNLSLKVVEHEENVNLAIENDGKLYAYHHAISPIAVIDQDGKDQLNATTIKDDISYDFKPEKLTDLSALQATFKPSSTGNSRLILHVKNTKWSGYLYNEFNQLFGEEHAKWVEKNKDKSKEEREAWMRQEGIKLLVDVKRNNVWVPLSEIDLIGDVSYESIALPIEIQSLENLEIRLRSGFHFWEVDFLGLAHEKEPIDLTIHDITPTTVIDSKGISQLEKLQNSDNEYHISTPENPTTEVTFENIPLPFQGKRSLFLEAGGYYLIQKQYTGKPNYKRLAKFKKPGEFSRFSKEKYTEFMLKAEMQ